MKVISLILSVLFLAVTVRAEFRIWEKTDGSVLIKADASASHQAVVNVLEAARLNGISKIAFATQQSSKPPTNKP